MGKRDRHVSETLATQALPRSLINGGRRGFLVGIEPAVLTRLLSVRAVQCAL